MKAGPIMLTSARFSLGRNVTHSDNHWSNKMMKQYIENTILLYVNDKRKESNLSNDDPALVISYNFKA